MSQIMENKRYTKSCLECKEAFGSNRFDAKFCTPKCRKRSGRRIDNWDKIKDESSMIENTNKRIAEARKVMEQAEAMSVKKIARPKVSRIQTVQAPASDEFFREEVINEDGI